MPLPIYAALCHRVDPLSSASAPQGYAQPSQSYQCLCCAWGALARSAFAARLFAVPSQIAQRDIVLRPATPSLPAMDRDARLFPAGYLCGL